MFLLTKGNFIMINGFRYGQTWKIWPSPLSLSLYSTFKDTLKVFNDFKNKHKSVWSNVFWYLKVCIFRNYTWYVVHWVKTNMLKKFPSDKINGRKNALFFLLRVPTHHSFTFNLRFLYELKHKVGLSKTVYGILHFRFRFAFIKVYIFV